eukprot:CAMPEP_0172891396 /NCGR_PEP_ID=MMETSP1075-20121228/143774_1 /TAXON_ID=2916 /ORGANISM="Ceratium fusus, Strain PA161109" /LENGTH=33 /DNA_ID= /DNA_START= /DNA_END= /DNA_ORIENTATION=
MAVQAASMKHSPVRSPARRPSAAWAAWTRQVWH